MVLGQGEPDRVGQPLPGQPVQELVGAAGRRRCGSAPSARVGCPARWPGSCRSAVSDDRDVVGGGVRPGVARPQQHRQRLPGAVPGAPWSTNAHNGWSPNPRLNVGAARSFSECAVTRVASRSMTSGAAGVGLVVGGMVTGQRPHPGPGRAPGRCRSPPTRRSRRRPARRPCGTPSDPRPPDRHAGFGAQQRDVGQAVPAHRQRHRQVEQDLRRVVHRRAADRHGASAADSAGPARPRATVSVSSTPPACDTTIDPAVSTAGHG